MRRLLTASIIVTALTLLGVTPVHMGTGALSVETICIDPGHGGSDPGAVYDDGTIYLEEADINLDVSYGLKALLEEDGAAVVMTRTDDGYMDNRDRYTFCNNAQATILVSVHTNSTTDHTMDGSVALYFHRDDEALAQAIYDVMYPALKQTAPDPDNFTGFGLDRFASGVLLKSDMPAAMMEPLFMSHPVEAELLVTPIYLDHGITPNPDCSECRRAQIAQAIHAGILNYVGAGADVPPSVSITNPADGDTVSGSVTLTADATDDEGVTQVEFFVDGSAIGTDVDGSDGWSTVWDTTAYADGARQVTAVATDTAGQTASDSISVTVDNEPSLGVTVTAIEPAAMQAGTTVDVSISGTGFASGADVALENGAGPAPTVSNVLVVDSTTITASITAKDGGPPRNRVWDVQVTNPDGSSGVLPGGFSVTP
jgi:N-acetylmuramoyl-L-alanine amidase